MAGNDDAYETELCEIMHRHGSDKGGRPGRSWHNYAVKYHELFAGMRQKRIDLFELGLGTNHTDTPSNMGVNGKPGASLRGFREYFPEATIVGADIDARVLFQDDRISTFRCDQTDKESIERLWAVVPQSFDIMIEDGLHEYAANVTFFVNSIHKLKPNGVYVIEDIMTAELERWKKTIEEWTHDPRFVGLTFEIVSLPNPANNGDNNLVIARK